MCYVFYQPIAYTVPFCSGAASGISLEGWGTGRKPSTVEGGELGPGAVRALGLDWLWAWSRS